MIPTFNNDRSSLSAFGGDQGASAEKPRCSVKDAARRMQLHPTTVYRMRRRPGPLRFVVDGRRIYVEMESLEELLPYQAPSNVAEVEGKEGALPEGTVAGDRNREQESRGSITQESLQKQVEPAGRSGQRELIMPKRHAVAVILYMA